MFTVFLCAVSALFTLTMAGQNQTNSSAAQNTPKSDWVEFVSKDYGFATYFPTAPETRTEKGQSTTTQVFVCAAPTSAFAVRYTKYPSRVEDPLQIVDLLDSARSQIVGNTGGQLLDEKRIQLGGNRGRQIRIA